jgi:hypothetical protein
MASFVLAAAFFAAVYIGQRAKLGVLSHYLLKAAKRVLGIPDFCYYAIADGIKSILTRGGKGLLHLRLGDPSEAQLCLFAF